MSFVTELREELVSAAEREQERRLPRIQVEWRPLLLTAAAAAALALIIVVAAGSLRTAPDDEGPIVAEPTPEGRDLFGGTLEPNVRYRTTEFVPRLSFVVDDDRWAAVDTTLAEELRLVRVTRGAPNPDPPRIQQLLFLRINEVAEPSVRGLEASLTAAPTDLYEWLRGHPDLRVGPARPVTVAGVPGERFAVRVRFDRPTHLDPWCQRFAQVPCTFVAPGMNWPDGARLRMTVLRTEPQPLVIAEGGLTAADLAAVEKAAGPVLESLRIGVR